MGAPQSNDTLQEWSASARYWQKHSATIRMMFAPLTQALIEEAGIIQGQSVLDVAGGPGEPSLTIAGVVGPAGSVVCTDAIAEMVATAESEAQRRGISNISFRQCMADSLPFATDSFDVVVSRLGAMFFPDPLVAFGEMLRVLKPRGALALAVWDKSEVNPFSYVVNKVIARFVETLPADPEAPGAFRFAEPGKLANILNNAGAVDVRERRLIFHLEAPISLEQFWELRSETSGTLREKLARLPAEQQREVGTEVQAAMSEYFRGGEMSIPARILIVTGRKPKWSTP